MIKTEKLVYGSANSSVQFEGSISYDDSFDTPRPGVLVCHAYGGHSEFDIKKSEQLAELGYFAFAMDLYCLLYTSPSPRDATLSRMPSSA